jgi:phosphoglycolate phosphatase-like HAD superfamily hydrolase
MKIITALDFDGVIINSALEAALVGQRAIAKVIEPSYLKEFSAARNNVLDCYDIMRFTIKAFEYSLPKLGEELNKDLALQIMGDARDSWIKSNEREWLSLHEFYPGVVSALNKWLSRPELEIHIVSKKQHRFIVKLLQSVGIELNPAHIFGGDSPNTGTSLIGDKVTYLQALQRNNSNSHYIFVEDRFPTLLNIIESKALPAYELYLATWGYVSTEALQLAHETAKESSQLSLLNVEEFTNLFS